MRNLYDVLGVESNASDKTIKKAYFKLIRKFTPDKEEEIFKELRHAYETLSDKNDREDYDMTLELSTDILEELESAYAYADYGDLKTSIKIQERVLKNCNNRQAKLRLGILCFKNQNFQKAISVFKEILLDHPEDYQITELLMIAYVERGWIKKAVAVYDILLESNIDKKDDIISMMSDAFRHKEKFAECIKFSNKIFKNNDVSVDTTIRLLENRLFALIELGIESAVFIEETALDYIGYVKEKHDVLDDYYDSIIFFIMKAFSHNTELALHQISLLESSIKTKKVNYLKLKNDAAKALEFSRLSKDSSINETLKYYVQSHIEVDSLFSRDNEVNTITCENDILENYTDFTSSFKIVEKKYPLCYKDIEDFVNKTKSQKDRKRLLKKNKKKLSNMFEDASVNLFEEFLGLDYLSNQPFFMDEDDIIEPYVRETAKVGRNDPCPCGSGKKYKKCCINN